MIEKIISSKLISITFVSYYIQLQFESKSCNCRLTAFNVPVIEKGDSNYLYEKSGYCDEICSLINRMVNNVQIKENEYIKIKFENRVFLRISLREEDYGGPEAVMFQDNNTDEWNVW